MHTSFLVHVCMDVCLIILQCEKIAWTLFAGMYVLLLVRARMCEHVRACVCVHV